MRRLRKLSEDEIAGLAEDMERLTALPVRCPTCQVTSTVFVTLHGPLTREGRFYSGRAG